MKRVVISTADDINADWIKRVADGAFQKEDLAAHEQISERSKASSQAIAAIRARRISRKHLAGRHPQKRHGWRYGSAFSSRSNYEFESEDEKLEHRRRSDSIIGRRAEIRKAHNEIRLANKSYLAEKKKLQARVVEAGNLSDNLRQDYDTFTDELWSSKDYKLHDRMDGVLSYSLPKELKHRTTLLNNAIRDKKDEKFIQRKRDMLKETQETIRAAELLRDKAMSNMIAKYGENPSEIRQRMLKKLTDSYAAHDKLEAEYKNFDKNYVEKHFTAMNTAMQHHKRRGDIEANRLKRMHSASIEKMKKLQQEKIDIAKRLKNEAATPAAAMERKALVNRMGFITDELNSLTDKTREDGRAYVMQNLAAKNPMKLDPVWIRDLDISKDQGKADLNTVERGVDKHSEDIYSGIRAFNRLVPDRPAAKDPPELVLAVTSDERAYHVPGTNRCVIDIRPNSSLRNRAESVVHEFSHWLEEKDPFIHYQCMKLLDQRTYKSSDITNVNGVEFFKPDKFLSYYQGKLYPDKGHTANEFKFSSVIWNVRATEILSVGLEYFFADPIMLARQDPEMFSFIYSVVRMGIN